MSDTPIIERSAKGKVAYYQGFVAGYEWALRGIRRGLSADDVQDACEQVAATMRSLNPEVGAGDE